MARHTAVFKFGSSVLRSEADLPVAVAEIQKARGAGARVLAVVSALGDTTDRLLQQARVHADDPEPGALASLLATGEAVSAALLGIALDRAGVPVVVLDPAQMGLRAEGDRLDARPCAVNARRIAEELERSVVVAPGFVGRGPGGATSLLGRGGSDYTALFLSARLGARRCVLFKDVDGLYTADPATDVDAVRYESVTWRTAALVGGRVVQEKAVQYAEFERLTFEITAPGAAAATQVGPGPDVVATPDAAFAAEACA